jgi:propionyl-CoA carboxylase beta chain
VGAKNAYRNNMQQGAKPPANDQRFAGPSTFVELDKFMTHRNHDFGMDKQKILGDGVVTGYGKLTGAWCMYMRRIFSVFGGSLSRANADKIVKVHGPVHEDGCTPDRIERQWAGAYTGRRGKPGRLCRHFLPQCTGQRSGYHRYRPFSDLVQAGQSILRRMTDFIFMTKGTSYMFVTGPDVIKTVTHEEVTKEDLGGAMTHNTKAGWPTDGR